MISRNTIIAGLVVIELAIVGEAVVAVRGGHPAPPAFRSDAAIMAPGHLREDGPHRTFRTGPSPELLVDIGYADLTILAGKPTGIDVGLSGSGDFGVFGSRAPISATADGETVRVASNQDRRWSTGDDRMVTLVVPPKTRVTVTNAGDIKASGLRAEASIKSIGRGSITIEDFAAPALELISSNGPISMHRVVTNRLDATSKNDRIEGMAMQVRDGSIQGDDNVRLGFAPGSDSLVSAQTDSGKIRSSGLTVVTSSATGRKGSGSDDDAASETVRVGAGTGRLDVHSNDGNIDLLPE